MSVEVIRVNFCIEFVPSSLSLRAKLLLRAVAPEAFFLKIGNLATITWFQSNQSPFQRRLSSNS